MSTKAISCNSVKRYADDGNDAAAAKKARKAAADKDRDQVAQKAAADKAKDAVPSWLSAGLVVKIMARSLKHAYKKKGVVRRIPAPHVAEVEVFNSGAATGGLDGSEGGGGDGAEP
jgi:hypothetical protein